MKGNNQNNYDRRPKRRKDKLNPYTIYSVGINTDDPHYYVSFVDIDDKRINVEVSKDVFDAFEQFELEDISYSNEVTNHYEHSDLLESTLMRRSNEASISSVNSDYLALRKQIKLSNAEPYLFGYYDASMMVKKVIFNSKLARLRELSNSLK